jgi:signal transduction histidine kinase
VARLEIDQVTGIEGAASDRGVVLVVDDSRMNRLVLQRSLEAQGHTVLLAEDGQQALDRIAQQPVDLVLLDIEMPVLDGYAVLERMKSNPDLRAIPVVVISAIEEQEAAVRCIELGAEDVLPKPFNPVLLRARLQASLARKRLHDLEQEYLAALASAKAAAEAANDAKSSFLANVSHELRTPLTSVLGFAKIARRQLDERVRPALPTDESPQAADAAAAVARIDSSLATIVSEGERLTALIDNVLDLAKIEAGRYELRRDRVDVAAVVDRAIAATAALADGKGLAVTRRLTGGTPDVIGDRDALVQVVVNLVSNAVKFTDRGEIAVAAGRRDGHVVVSVSDTGIGLAPAQRDQIFEKFVQGSDPRTQKPRGTGLGLAICREIVERHGGRIWVASEPGRGSTFSFSLPPAPEAAAGG